MSVTWTDEHEACKQEMRRINKDWAKEFDTRSRIRGVIQSTPDGNRYLQVTDVQYTPEGIMVYVQ
jgi:hypothetical protein